MTEPELTTEEEIRNQIEDEITAAYLSSENIIRSIEFPPEYHQAGIGILNDFGSVLRSKYPDKPATVRIEQKGLKVTMVIETPDGERKEEIEELLSDYALAILGKIIPKEYLDDRLQIADLHNQLRLAKAEIESKKELLRISEVRANRLSALLHEVQNKQLPKNRRRRQAKSLLDAFDKAWSKTREARKVASDERNSF